MAKTRRRMMATHMMVTHRVRCSECGFVWEVEMPSDQPLSPFHMGCGHCGKGTIHKPVADQENGNDG